MRIYQNSAALWVLGVSLCLGVIGCGRETASTKGSTRKAQVSGTVTMGGQPLEGAEVYFVTEKFTGFAKTDAAGKYRLAQGAAIGVNKVYFSKLEGGTATSVTASDPVAALNDPGQVEAATASGASSAKQLIPPEYSSQTSSRLTFDVSEAGAKDADFNL